MVKRIFVWVGHPREASLSHGMADAYSKGATENGAEIRRMNLHDMQFDADLTEGYHARKEHEPCIVEWRENIKWAEHICWAYPVWWGAMPAKAKGLIDRAFLPGFAMEYPEDKIFWTKLLTGRSADVLLTSDAPAWYDRVSNARPAKNQVKNTILKFSGITPVNVLQVGTVKTASDKKINRWLAAAEKRGGAAAR